MIGPAVHGVVPAQQRSAKLHTGRLAARDAGREHTGLAAPPQNLAIPLRPQIGEGAGGIAALTPAPLPPRCTGSGLYLLRTLPTARHDRPQATRAPLRPTQWGSRNGTCVNGHPVHSSPVAAGGTIRLGRRIVEVRP